jgi:hypothetical protein
VIYNATGDKDALYNEVLEECDRAFNGGYFGIYAGPNDTGASETSPHRITDRDIAAFERAMDKCTQL